jgi:HAD superfamily hydrolase (TIGR01509 family)
LSNVIVSLEFSAVIFDMDGLLIDTERIFRDALVDSAAVLGYHLPDAVHRKMVGLPGRECDALLQDFFGPDFSMEEYRRQLRLLIESRLASGIPLRAGVIELLDYLDARSIPKAVATSSGRQTAEQHLLQCGIRHRFATIVTRDDVARGKPYPDVYLKAAENLGISPARCIALEDSHHGIIAAHAAGTMAIMVPDLLEPTAEIAALCVALLDDLHHVRRLFAAEADRSQASDRV